MHKKKKKIERKYVILTGIISISIFIFLSIKIVNRKSISLPEKVIKDSVLFVSKIVYTPISFIYIKYQKR